tara:strand:- start:9819 stop:10352 length:534 start_codon:yes stop_codon:yes gene_type:complete
MSTLSPERVLEILDKHIWERPDDYAAFDEDADPVGDYVIYARHRDSSIMDDTNYTEIFRTLSVLANIRKQRDKVYDFRANHWAVGWVEYIIVRQDAHPDILEQAAEYLCALADYPCLDDDTYSERQWDAILDYWERCSLRERVDYCRDNDVSVFAARPNQPIPDAVFDDLRDSGSFQ